MLGSEIKTMPMNEVTGVVNRQAEYDGFVTSFMSWHDQGMGPDSKDGETALIKDGCYYILNGDWMLAYSELAPQGWDACYALFCRKYPEFGSTWSEQPE